MLLYGDVYWDASGYAKILSDLIPEFLKAGHEVRQVGLNYNGVSKREELIQVYPTRVWGVKSHWAPEALEVAIKDFEPEIVFTIGDYFALPEIVQVLSAPTKVSFKWIHYGVMDGEPFNKDLISATSWCNYHLYQADFTKRTVENAIPGIRGKTIYPAVNKEVFHPLEEKEKEELRKNLRVDETFNVVFVGRNQYRKNLPALFTAIKKVHKIIPNIRLIHHSIPTVDPSGAPNSYDLETIIREMDIEKLVSYIPVAEGGILSFEVVNQLYNLGDLFVLPTMGEGFGLPLTEAMACGLPTIGTDFSAVTEVIGDRGLLAKVAEYVYVEGNLRHAVVDTDDLAQCIYRLSGDQDLRKTCIEKGFKFTDTLTPDKVAKRILNVFEEVVKKDYQPKAVE